MLYLGHKDSDPDQSFLPPPPGLLPVEDLATLALDYIAEQRGYARVTAVKAPV